VRFRARLTGVEADLARLAVALDPQLDAALALFSARVADAARASHPFQNRTGDLESSIRALDTHGDALAGTLEGGVIADEEYAEHVDARLPFLQPAFDRTEGEADRFLQDALDEAARLAGW
jgi:hypothetical protein